MPEYTIKLQRTLILTSEITIEADDEYAAEKVATEIERDQNVHSVMSWQVHEGESEYKLDWEEDDDTTEVTEVI